MKETLKLLITATGVGHILLSVGSLIVPKSLEWNKHLEKLPALLRQLFWTYAGYILAFHLSFATVSILGAEDLLDKSFLAKCITVFISVYWLVRLSIQFFAFDKSEAPKGLFYTLGEIALVSFFIIFTIVYGAAFFYNNSWI